MARWISQMEKPAGLSTHVQNITESTSFSILPSQNRTDLSGYEKALISESTQIAAGLALVEGTDVVRRD